MHNIYIYLYCKRNKRSKGNFLSHNFLKFKIIEISIMLWSLNSGIQQQINYIFNFILKII